MRQPENSCQRVLCRLRFEALPLFYKGLVTQDATLVTFTASNEVRAGSHRAEGMSLGLSQVTFQQRGKSTKTSTAVKLPLVQVIGRRGYLRLTQAKPQLDCRWS